jgi:integrase
LEESGTRSGAAAVGVQIQDAYFRALGGIRARLRGKQPIEPKDPFLLRDVATVLIDCALRPAESFRLRWEYVPDGAVNIHLGKPKNARRIPLSDRALRLLRGSQADIDI